MSTCSIECSGRDVVVPGTILPSRPCPRGPLLTAGANRWHDPVASSEHTGESACCPDRLLSLAHRSFHRPTADLQRWSTSRRTSVSRMARQQWAGRHSERYRILAVIDSLHVGRDAGGAALVAHCVVHLRMPWRPSEQPTGGRSDSVPHERSRRTRSLP
jgi:hypothetical protein